MVDAARVPVLVGVGQILQRLDDPERAKEPLDLMVDALVAAERDAGVEGLLEEAASLHVLRGAWRYEEPGRIVAQRIGAKPEEIVGTPYGGNYAQGCVLDAARSIAEGERRVALVLGAENGRSQGQARRRGIALETTEAPGYPDRLLGDDKPLFHPAEQARSMNSASDVYAVIDSAIRHESGASLEEHRRRIARLWEGFNRVARSNPNAWIQKPYDADFIATPGPDNPMISFPYTRLMNANARVDMAAGIILCSLAAARDAGVDEAKLVYLHAGTEAEDCPYLTERAEFHRSPAMRVAGAKALDLAGRKVDEVDHIDLYSCFPSAVMIAARELGLGEDRPLTVCGGLTFCGGPLNSYTLHSIARMVEVLRADPGSTGLVSGNGGWLAKHSFGVYSTTRPADGFRYARPQAEIDALPTRRALVDWNGPVTIEAYTVAHRDGAPAKAQAACLTDDGARTWAILEEPELLERMMREEFCGRRGRVDGRGGLTIETD